MHIPRAVKKLFIGTLVTSLLLVIAGVAYALYTDQAAPVPLSDASAETSTPTSPIRHITPSSNAPASAAVEAISTPVGPGDEASISVQSLEGATCTIDIGYIGAPSDTAFKQQVANSYGTVFWNWPIAPSAPAGNWPVKVTCVYRGRSAFVSASLEIDKK